MLLTFFVVRFQVLSALDDTSAHELLSYIIPICPHQQAKAWLLDTSRRHILHDLDRLQREAKDGEGDNNYQFLGDVALEPYLLTPLNTCAADTKTSSLSEALDVHLAVLATCRIVLLRRKAISQLNAQCAERVCSQKAMDMIAKSVLKIQKTLFTHSSQPIVSEDAMVSDTVIPEATPVVKMRGVNGESISLTPTPSMSSFHLDLLSEATTYITEILDMK